MIDLEHPTIIITLEGDDFYALIDKGEGADPRYGLLDAKDSDDDRYGNDRAALIRLAIRWIDKRLSELRAEAGAEWGSSLASSAGGARNGRRGPSGGGGRRTTPGTAGGGSGSGG